MEFRFRKSRLLFISIFILFSFNQTIWNEMQILVVSFFRLPHLEFVSFLDLYFKAINEFGLNETMKKKQTATKIHFMRRSKYTKGLLTIYFGLNQNFVSHFLIVIELKRCACANYLSIRIGMVDTRCQSNTWQTTTKAYQHKRVLSHR